MTDDKAQFLAELAPAVQRLAARTGLPASTVLAQAILESDWGRSALAQRARNLFGIKAHRGSRARDSIRFSTTEYEGASPRRESARFAAYATYDDCLADYARVLSHRRYAPEPVSLYGVLRRGPALPLQPGADRGRLE